MQLRFVRREVWAGEGLMKVVKILQFREELDDDGQSYWSDWKDVPEEAE